MKKKRNKIFSLDDVRNWRELKKDELELEKLKFHAEREELSRKVGNDFLKVMFYEGAILVGEKVLTNVITNLLKPKKKKKKKAKAEVEAKRENEGEDRSSEHEE